MTKRRIGQDQWQKVEKLIEREAGKAGLRGKLNAKCIDCTFDPLAPGNWRVQVGNCTVSQCPLWPIRPMSVTQSGDKPDFICVR